jgi:iron-sulfur cluster assembly protein
MTYVRITDRAIEAFRAKLEKRGTPDAYIRLGVLGSGCNGYKWHLAFDDDAPRKSDLHFFYYGIRVLIDPKSAPILDGVSLDYKSSLKETGFEFSSPKVVSKCGCGSSFSIG